LVYTTLIFIAEPPRGLLLIGYPMMIGASGLLYRVRFVVFVTAMCIAAFTILLATVNDSPRTRLSGLFCVRSMTRHGSDDFVCRPSDLVSENCLNSKKRRHRGVRRPLIVGEPCIGATQK
jgi:hypothetical protein